MVISDILTPDLYNSKVTHKSMLRHIIARRPLESPEFPGDEPRQLHRSVTAYQKRPSMGVWIQLYSLRGEAGSQLELANSL